jgi:hypothetical protein
MAIQMNNCLDPDDDLIMVRSRVLYTSELNITDHFHQKNVCFE